MSGLLWLLVATIASIELLALTRLFDDLAILVRLGARAGRLLLRRGGSEWATQKALRLRAAQWLGQAFACLAGLLLVAAPLILLLTLDRLAGLGVRQAWGSAIARTALLIAATLYIVVRQHRRQRGRGAFGERLVQRIALGTHFVPDLSFDRERRHYLAAARAAPAEPPVFVAGLARAGTKLIARALHDSGGFAALNDRDLPFPLAPNLWARLAAPLRRALPAPGPAEGDDGPAALEEIFWRHHDGALHSRAGGLGPEPAPGAVEDFVDYVRLVQLRRAQPRYVSNNNNNIMRLPALVAAFPGAWLVHPFRDPVQQAASLLDQHRAACWRAGSDRFRAHWMTWLGQYEYGPARRRLPLPGGPGPGDDPDGVDYWLKAWIAVYGALLDAPREVRARQLFVDYDRLAADPWRWAPLLRARLGLRDRIDPAQFQAPLVHHANPSPRLLQEADRVHAALRARTGAEAPAERREAPPERRRA
jgi:hypothetical protein